MSKFTSILNEIRSRLSGENKAPIAVNQVDVTITLPNGEVYTVAKSQEPETPEKPCPKRHLVSPHFVATIASEADITQYSSDERFLRLISVNTIEEYEALPESLRVMGKHYDFKSDVKSTGFVVAETPVKNEHGDKTYVVKHWGKEESLYMVLSSEWDELSNGYASDYLVGFFNNASDSLRAALLSHMDAEVLLNRVLEPGESFDYYVTDKNIVQKVTRDYRLELEP